jgi:molybdate transport system substrate-binding protein
VRKLGLMLLLTAFVVLPGSPLLAAPPSPPSLGLSVAAAANLTDVFTVIAQQFQAETGINVTLTFGATGTFAAQIRNGTPYDLFAAADVVTVDALIQEGLILAESKTLYARGKLIIWWPSDSAVSVTKLTDLLDPAIAHIGIADPDVAPYGEAAKETLMAAGLWETLQPKLVVAGNITDTQQLVVDGKAEVAFIAISLITPGADRFFAPSVQLYQPIDQALGILTSSTHQEAAQDFVTYLTSGARRDILEDFWYTNPCTCADKACESSGLERH